MASNDQGERSQSKVGSKDITSVLEWLPPAESLEANMAAAERLPPQFQQAASPEKAVKQYLSMEAVPVLTQALMDLCMEETPPAPGETIPWLIKWLEKLQASKQNGK